MPLTICPDVSPADWIVTSDVPWERLVTFGPAGFPAYARVRFIPDPVWEGQRETDADPDSTPAEIDQWRALLRLLAAHTARPDDCFFALWDGWGFPDADQRWPTFAVPPTQRPAFRRYYLFEGPLTVADHLDLPAQAGIWDVREFAGGGTPAFVWPSDHAWCVTADIDPHWLGVGATTAVIRAIVANPELDAVEADPAQPPPAYR